MRNSLGVAVALGVVALGVASCGGPQTPGPHPQYQGNVSVTLKDDGGGACSKLDPVGAVGGHNGEAVSWKITSHCSKGTFVTLRDFKPKTASNTDVYPLDYYEAIWIDPGATLTLHARLRKATSDTYSFHFYCDERPQTSDPDIVIDT
jgi:hypothetical protein